MRVRLTKRTVESIKAGARDVLVWDTDLPGFGLKVTPKGAKTYLYQYRDKTRRTRRVTIGQHGKPWTPEKARIDADDLSAKKRLGQDPAQEKTDRREAKTVEGDARPCRGRAATSVAPTCRDAPP